MNICNCNSNKPWTPLEHEKIVMFGKFWESLDDCVMAW